MESEVLLYMDSRLWSQLILLMILLVGSGFFSMSETALMSLSKIDARHMVTQNIKGAKLLEKLLEDQSKLLGSILIGNNIVNIGASSLATVLASDIFGSAGAGIATGIMTLLVLIFGEITPKSIATQNPQKVSLFVSKPIALIVLVLAPAVKVLMAVANVIIKLVTGDADNNRVFMTQDQLKTIVTVSHEEGVDNVVVVRVLMLIFYQLF